MAKIDEILNNNSTSIQADIKKEFESLVKQVVKQGVNKTDAKRIVKEHLKKVYRSNIKNIADGMEKAVKRSFSASSVENMEVQGVTLSKRLYNRIKDVENDTMRVINNGLKDNKTIKEVSMLLYEGYNFKDDPLHVKKALPKYLLEDIATMSATRINKIKTPALRASYLQALNSKSDDALYKNLQRAFYERNRYYADRIAQTEIFRAYSEKQAKEMMQDDTLEVVRIKLSSSHPTKDICDYHTGVNKYGLGKGYYPKEKAPLPPFHPFCRCLLMVDITKSAKDATLDTKADEKFMKQLNSYEQYKVLGSKERVIRFKRVPDVIETSYYDEPLRLGNIGYNGGMKDIKYASQEEINAIEEYTGETSRKRHTKIKSIIAKDYENLTKDEKYFIPYAKTLENMFTKYNSDFPKNKPLFRGLPVTNTEFTQYASLTAGAIIVLDKSLMSFSKSIEVALDYGEVDYNENKSLIIIAKKRKSNDLDLTKYSFFEDEAEILLNKSLNWNVIKLDISEDNKIITLEVEEL